MNKTAKLILKISVCVLCAALVTALIIGNVLCKQYFYTINEYFYGESVITESEQLKSALEAGDKLNVQIEQEGIVLFRNENMNRHDESGSTVMPALPMSEKELEKVNVFGWSATDRGWVAGSDGSCNANSGKNKDKYDSILDSFEAAKIGTAQKPIEYNRELIAMYESFRVGRAERRGLTGHDQFFMLIEPARAAYDVAGDGGKSILQNAIDFSDVAIVVISRLGGENNDLPYFQLKNTTGKYSDSDNLPRDDSRTYLDLSTEEEDLLAMVRENFRKVIVVYNGCNNMNLKYLEDYDVDACISVNGPGQSGTDAIPQILSGEINPSGKSVQIQPYDLKSDPSFYNTGKYNVNGHTATYVEDIYVGYRWYETADAEGYWDDVDNEYGKGYDGVVQYPFGFGLSYTTFDWEVKSVDPAPGSKLDKDSVITVDVAVTNTGDVAGKDVVQLYYTPPYYKGGIEKPHVALVAFAKTALLQPGKSETVELQFTMYDMASYDCYDRNYNRFCGYELDFGKYEVKLMRDSHTLDACDGALIEYTLGGGITFRNDTTTGNSVVNRFTNYSVINKNEDGDFEKVSVSAYAGAALDGSDASDSDIAYLTRSDFSSTFNTKNLGARRGEKITAAENYLPDMGSATMPTFNDDSGLRLTTKQDGSSFSASELANGLTNAKVNEELVFELGSNYDSDTWNKLLDQMSETELSTLVQDGNYYNREVASIGKPKLLDSDGPSGLNRHVAGVGDSSRTEWTMYSMPAVIAQSWNTALSYSFGLSVANESINSGNNGWYAPGANIMRSMFCGRNSEYYSEDPLLSGIMAGESCRGAQNNGMNVYLKHFAVNETESGRIGLYTWLTEQNLREIYLKPFEIAVKRGGANGIMTSLNRIGSVWSGGCKAMTTDILRGEWGFKGSVVTDTYIAGTNNIKQGLYGGVSLYLGVVSAGNRYDTNDPVVVTAARRAAKDIIYAWCNSYYTSATHDKSQDFVSADVTNFVQGEMPKPYWVIGLVVLDILVFGGAIVCILFMFLPKRRKKYKPVTVNGVTYDASVDEDFDKTFGARATRKKFLMYYAETQNTVKTLTERIDAPSHAEVEELKAEIAELKAELIKANEAAARVEEMEAFVNELKQECERKRLAEEKRKADVKDAPQKPKAPTAKQQIDELKKEMEELKKLISKR